MTNSEVKLSFSHFNAMSTMEKIYKQTTVSAMSNVY